jgi:hypothetical protein
MIIYSALTQGPLPVPGYIDPDDKFPVEIFWGAPTFIPGNIYLIDSIVKPTVDDGYYYKCTKTGRTDATEPVWSTSTITGNARFTAISYDLFVLSDETITSSVWAVSDGVTISSPSADDNRTGVMISLIPDNLVHFDLTNQVTKTGGKQLSKTLRYFIDPAFAIKNL